MASAVDPMAREPVRGRVRWRPFPGSSEPGVPQAEITLAMAEVFKLSARVEELAERRKEAIRRAFTRFHALALGCAVGVTAGLAVTAATLLLWMRGGKLVGENLRVLSSYFPGYQVDLAGAAVGGLYGFAAGFVAGFAIAAFRNLALRVALALLRQSGDRWRRRHLLDEI